MNDLELIKRYSPIVGKAASKLHAKLPKHVQREDLECAGMRGLWDAILAQRRGDVADFEAYANLRIRGAMYDELRRADWATRNARREEKASGKRGVLVLLFESTEEFEHVLPTSRDVGAELDEVRALHRVMETLSKLPAREEKVLRKHFLEEQTQAEIAEELGVTAPRVNQVIRLGVARLRSLLGPAQPKNTSRQPRQEGYHLARLAVGESFFVETAESAYLRAYVSQYGRRHGKSFSVRKTPGSAVGHSVTRVS